MSIPVVRQWPKLMVNSALRAIVAAWLAEGMEQADLTPTTLSRQSKVSRDTIYRILAQETGAGEETLTKLSEAIGRPLPDLRDASDGPTRPQEPRSEGEAALDAMRADKAATDVLLVMMRSFINRGEAMTLPPEILSRLVRLLEEPPG